MVLNSSVEISHGVKDSVKLAAPAEENQQEQPVALEMAIPAPLPMVRAHLKQFEDDSMRKLLQRFDGVDVLPNGWREGPRNKGIQVVYGEVAGSEWYTMKTTGTLHVSAEKAARVLMSANMVPKFDDMTAEVKVVEKLSEFSEVRQVSAKPVMFTTARDFCVVSTLRNEADGRILIATRSVEHLAQRKGFVRATIIISGYVVVPHPTNPNQCEMSVIAHMDLGGNLPAMVVRYLGLSAPIKMVEKIHEVTMSA